MIYSTPTSRAKDKQDSITASLWANWHARALYFSSDDTDWIDHAILARLPCGECKGHAVTYIADNPPRWDDYFAWTVEFHNAVNQRLGKPEFSVDQARALWSLKALLQ